MRSVGWGWIFLLSFCLGVHVRWDRSVVVGSYFSFLLAYLDEACPLPSLDNLPDRSPTLTNDVPYLHWITYLIESAPTRNARSASPT